MQHFCLECFSAMDGEAPSKAMRLLVLCPRLSIDQETNKPLPMSEDGCLQNVFSISLDSCTYEYRVIVTAHAGSIQIQGRQNPNMEWQGGHKDPPQGKELLAIEGN